MIGGVSKKGASHRRRGAKSGNPPIDGGKRALDNVENTCHRREKPPGGGGLRGWNEVILHKSRWGSGSNGSKVAWKG